MLSASRPSRSASCSAASTTCSRDSEPRGRRLRGGLTRSATFCSVAHTVSLTLTELRENEDYVFIATIPLRPGSPIQQVLPTGAKLTIQRVLALTPALLVMAISNGFQEELLFRGLFLQRYTLFFGAGVANVLQAAVFAVAHVGVTYTPLLLVFLVAVVFPLGLLGGYVLRASKRIFVPAILHGAFDLQIYLGFLASVS